MRKSTWTLLLAGAVLAAGSAFTGPNAFAGNREKAPLVRGEGSRLDEQGTIVFKGSARGAKIRVRLSNLLPREDYVLCDGETGDELATLRANRRGRAKAKLRSRDVDVDLAGLRVEVRHASQTDPVLEGRVPDGNDRSEPGDDEIVFRFGEVGTATDGPGPYTHITLSSFAAGRRSEEAIAVDVFGGDAEVAGPITFHVADGEGALTLVATIEAFDWEGGDSGPFRPAGLQETGTASGGNTITWTWTHDESECPFPGGDFRWPVEDWFSWYATAGGDPDLPFGVDAVERLSGRAFEVRDGNDAVLLEGDLPELETVDLTPPPAPEPPDMTFLHGSVSTGDDDGIEASLSLNSNLVGDERSDFLNFYGASDTLEGNLTLWITDGDALEKVATIEPLTFIWYDPLGWERGGDAAGNDRGANRGTDDHAGNPWTDEMPGIWTWTASNVEWYGDPLPFGVDEVADLVGRTFELRDAEGHVLWTDVLPEMSELDWMMPPVHDKNGAGIDFLGR